MGEATEAISDLQELLPSPPAMARRGLGLAAHVRRAGGPLHTLVLLEPHVVDDAVRARLAPRLALVRRLRHPGLVGVREGGLDNGEQHPWLLEEPSTGRTLRRLLEEEGPLAPEDGLQVAVDVLNALEYVHRAGLLHAGLSLEQVLVTRREGRARARVLEPGLVHLLGSPRSTPFGPVRVDPDYAAPEVVRQEPLSPAADVYSVGVLLYEALTGRHPIPAPARNRLLHRLNEPARDLPEGIFADEARYEQVRLALTKAQAKAPESRYGSARAFALALAGTPGEDPAPEPILPEGGPCADPDCEAQILPQERRTWSRHDSDRPFRCPRCEQVFCGARHWDPLGWTCRSCEERAPAAPPRRTPAVRLDTSLSELPPAATPAGEGPAGEVEAPEAPTEAIHRQARETARRPSERLLVLRELLSSSKEGRPSRVESKHPAGASPPSTTPRSATPRPATPAATPPEPELPEGTDQLMVSAWEREKARHEQAQARATEARTRSGPQPRPPSSASSSAGPALPSGSGGAEPRRRPSGKGRVVSESTTGRTMGRPATAPLVTRDRSVWKLVSGILAVGLTYMAWSWHGQLQDFAHREQDLQEELTRYKHTSTDVARAAERRDSDLQRLRKALGRAEQRGADQAADLDRLRAQAEARSEQLRTTQDQLAKARQAAEQTAATLAGREQELQQARTEGEALRARLQRLEAELALRSEQRDEARAQVAALDSRIAAREPRALLAQLVPQGGQVAELGGGPGARARCQLRWGPDAAPLVAGARQGTWLVAVRLHLAQPAEARLRTAPGGRILPRSTSEDEPGLLCFWLDPRSAAQLEDEGGLQLLAEGAGADATRTRVLEASLVGTPLPDDARRRLQELERRGRW